MKISSLYITSISSTVDPRLSNQLWALTFMNAVRAQISELQPN